MINRLAVSLTGACLLFVGTAAEASDRVPRKLPGETASGKVVPSFPSVTEFSPFGIRFGSSPSDNQQRLIKYVNLSQYIDIKMSGQSCEEFSRDWMNSSITINDSVHSDMHSGYVQNEYRFDFSLNGRARAALYSLDFSSAPVLGCAMYFDEKLYGIAIMAGAFSPRTDVNFSQIKDTLNEKYGNYISTSFDNAMLGEYIKFSLPNGLTINYRAGGGFYGAESVVYIDGNAFGPYLNLAYSGYVQFRNEKMRRQGSGL